MSDGRPPRPDALTVEPDGVPEQLRDRDQWVCWRYKWDTDRDEWTKVPVDVTTGGFAKSTDSGTWTSFENALAYHDREDRDTDGVGVVVHEEDIVVGLDLDDCRDPSTGDIDEWAANLPEAVETYTEVSPSETGLRLFGFGFLPDDGTRADVEDTKGHIEMYETGRYLTVTGHHVDGTPEDLRQVNDEIGEVHAEYIADDDPEPESTKTAGDGGVEAGSGGANPRVDAGRSGSLTDADLIERAKGAKNGDKFARLWRGDTSGHPSHSEADLALVGLLAFWTGGDRGRMSGLFEQSGLYREKWDRDDYRDRTIEKALSGRTDFYEPGGGADASDAAGDETGDGCPEPDWPLTRRNGGYALYHPPQGDDGEGWYEQLTNFEIEATTFLRSPNGDGVQADLTVHPGDEGAQYDVTTPMTSFNDLRAFKRDVVTDRTTTFDGDTEKLNRLRRFVGGQDAPERTGVEQIGLFGDEYDELVTPDGTLGATGWIEEPEFAYVKQGIGIESKWSLDHESGDEFEPVDVAEVLETLPRTRESDRLLPVLGWFYASGFRPLIHEWTGEFNILNVTGGTGAGKSSTLGILWRLFGMDDDPLSVAEETKFAVTRSMAGTNSVPVWFDEYRPATTDTWRIDALHGLLRTVTRGGTVQRGNADKTTDEYTLSAPVAVSGEQRIQGSAEQRRCVMTTFSPTATDDGTDTARAYKDLTGEGYLDDGEFVGTDAADPRAHALAYYRFVTEFEPEDARERWDTAAEDVADMLADFDDIEGLGTAAQQGLQTVVFGLRLYREFADSVSADVVDLIDESGIESAVRYSAREFVDGGHKSHVDTLVELVAAAARAEYIEEEEHYSVVKNGTPNAEIRVNMTAAFDQITRYVGDHNVSADILDTYGDYRDRFKEAHENNGGYVVSYRQNTRGIGRAIGIHARRATDALDGFEARALNCEIVEDRGGNGDGNDDDDNEIPQGERLELVKSTIDDLCERDDGCEHARHGDIMNTVLDVGVSQSNANAALDKLSREGEVYQPLTGQYRVK